jgi:hypothetical protein
MPSGCIHADEYRLSRMTEPDIDLVSVVLTREQLGQLLNGGMIKLTNVFRGQGPPLTVSIRPQHPARYRNDGVGHVVSEAAKAALLAAAATIEKRAEGAGRIIRNPGQTKLCATSEHDDRYCSICDHLEIGMDVAAQMLRKMATVVTEVGPADPAS